MIIVDPTFFLDDTVKSQTIVLDDVNWHAPLFCLDLAKPLYIYTYIP